MGCVNLFVAQIVNAMVMSRLNLMRRAIIRASRGQLVPGRKRGHGAPTLGLNFALQRHAGGTRVPREGPPAQEAP